MQIFSIQTLRDGDCILTRVKDTQLFRKSPLFDPDLIVLNSFYSYMRKGLLIIHCTDDEDPFVYLEIIEQYYNQCHEIVSELQMIFPKISNHTTNKQLFQYSAPSFRDNFTPAALLCLVKHSVMDRQ